MKYCEFTYKKALVLLLVFLILPLSDELSSKETSPMKVMNSKILGLRKINPTAVEVVYANNQCRTFDFYGENIFRVFQDNNGGILRDPQAIPQAKILVDNPRKEIDQLVLSEDKSVYSISTKEIRVELCKVNSLMKVYDLQKNVLVFEELEMISFEQEKVSMTIMERDDEYFYGGGVQNGRFSHKGKKIAIENQNSWTDGGVASPNPFYWSTGGYGVMWNTFKKGYYDFGATKKGRVNLYHETDYLDIFLMIDDGAIALLNDFFQLTGNPVLLPKFGFYQGHLNAYNRDFWKEDVKGILFEDGRRYKESQKENGGTKESLNGEKDNYQFSARAVIDRYKANDMPLGWLLPNDGYGAGYGQTDTLDGNIINLKRLGEYARQNGVEVGLWTQSDLYPKEGISPLLQRDIVREVRDAGVRVLKTDVAWVGAGYSFGLNGVADVAHIMPYYGNNSRPFIISLDGWAGTQRHAGIWSGDQTGGVWEYIRFHIPTYIGSGLSGQPNISSDMDGIFGGMNPIVNTRDFQWKTFSPMQLNMDGWGANEKYPHALGEPVTSINRWYLKMKSALMPYIYSVAKEAIKGLPMVRAMFLEYPNAYTKGVETQYQYLFGPSFLVAPIFQATKSDEKGNDIRDGIYLPEGTWIDYFSGEKYQGGCILNNFDAPLWKLPLFVKSGAIIPMVNPNNNISEIDNHNRIYEIYPEGKSHFVEYDDDGITEDYKKGEGVTTKIESIVDGYNRVTIEVSPSEGDFAGFIKQKSTEFRINVSERPGKIVAWIGKKKICLKEATSMSDFLEKQNVFFYEQAPNLNRFATKDSNFEKTVILKNPQLFVKIQKVDVTLDRIVLSVSGFRFTPKDRYRVQEGALTFPILTGSSNDIGACSVAIKWNAVLNADFYEIDFNGMRYTTIKNTELLFKDLIPETLYPFKLRAVNKDGVSDWVESQVTTKSDPLEFAIRGIIGEATVASQGRGGIKKLFDFVETGDAWHTKYGQKAVPFDIIIDLITVNKIEKLQYLPRLESRNGTFLRGHIYCSNDKVNWEDLGLFEWENNCEVKTWVLKKQTEARYIKLSIMEGVGDFGSGRELYVFKVPGTKGVLQGDINEDGQVDINDLTSYMNYTGLRENDSEFEGYISKGDINKNGLIDAYDISVVASQLQGGVYSGASKLMDGTIELSVPKRVYEANEIINIQVKGVGLSSVNAFSFALPYTNDEYEFVGIEIQNTLQMENLTYDRQHTNGSRALYPTLVNIGNQDLLDGSVNLCLIKFRAKKALRFGLILKDGLIVDRKLNSRKIK